MLNFAVLMLIFWKSDTTLVSQAVCQIRRSVNQRVLMPIHLAYIMLFAYFCVACKNSEFCYYIFLHNSFDFSRKDRSMCESYTIHEPQKAIYENPAKTGLHTSFLCYHAL